MIPGCTRVLTLIHFWPFHLPSRIGVRTAPATWILCFSSPRIRWILHPTPSRNCGRRRRNSWRVGTWIQVFRWRWVGEGSAWWHLCPKICKLRWAVVKLLWALFGGVFFFTCHCLLADVFKCQLILCAYYVPMFWLVYEFTIQHISPKTSPAPASGGPDPSHFRSPRWPLDLGFGVWKGYPQQSQSPGWVHGSATWRRVMVVSFGCKIALGFERSIGKWMTYGITLGNLCVLVPGVLFWLFWTFWNPGNQNELGPGSALTISRQVRLVRKSWCNTLYSPNQVPFSKPFHLLPAFIPRKSMATCFGWADLIVLCKFWNKRLRIAVNGRMKSPLHI